MWYFSGKAPIKRKEIRITSKWTENTNYGKQNEYFSGLFFENAAASVIRQQLLFE